MQPRPCPSARIPAWAGRRVASCFDLASPRGGGRNRPRIAPGDTDCRPGHMAGRRRCPPGPGATAIAPSTTRVFPSPPARGAQLHAFAGRTCADQAAWNLRHTAGGEGLSALDEASAHVNAHDPLLTPYPSAANVAASRRSCTTRGPSVRCRGQQCPGSSARSPTCHWRSRAQRHGCVPRPRRLRRDEQATAGSPAGAALRRRPGEAAMFKGHKGGVRSCVDDHKDRCAASRRSSHMAAARPS